jgi:hypothetical protein
MEVISEDAQAIIARFHLLKTFSREELEPMTGHGIIIHATLYSEKAGDS